MTTRDCAGLDLLWVDEVYDREFGSDVVSRYGAYLRSRAHLFADEGTPLDAAGFTILAWQIANSPVMSPGYVRRRPDIEAVTCRHSEEPGALVADVEARLRWPPGLHASGPLAGWRSWALEENWGDQPPRYVEPGDDQPALLITAHLWVPIPEPSLPAPRHTLPGDVDVADAKRAVAAVCRHVNAAAGPLVAAVRECLRGGRR
jgi:hypothetical protein